MKKIVIFGAGGFGREVIEVVKDCNKINKEWDILGFVDDTPSLRGKCINGYPILGNIDWLIKQNDEINCVIAVGDPRGKKQVAEKLEKSEINFANVIHPSVMMSEFVEFGKGVILCAGCILTANIRIGNHVCVHINSTIGHDAVLEDFSCIMPAVKISGNVVLKKGTYIGAGATLIPKVSVGEWTIIGAGTVVIKDVPDHIVAVGVPAKVVKSTSDHDSKIFLQHHIE